METTNTTKTTKTATTTRCATAFKWAAGAAGAAAAAYVGYAGVTWLRYGKTPVPAADERDSLLDRFMPDYDVVDRHHVHVQAPAPLVFATACDTDFYDSPVVRAIFRAREVVLGSAPGTAVRPHGLVALTQSMGWRVLAEQPGHAIVVGAATRPWEADVVFRPLAPEAFAAFNDPDLVKIAWTLRAEPDGDGASTLFTETRVVTTDAAARRRFRRYWAFFSPGIVLIRYEMLRAARADAERRYARQPAVA